MSEPMRPILTPLQRWALPGGSHDRLVRLLRKLLPAGIGALSVVLLLIPLASNDEMSFVLDKDKVDVARERLRTESAVYRGEDSKGQPFRIVADSAIQQSSLEPVVKLRGLMAEIQLVSGPARLSADAGRYDMDRDIVNVDGPIRFVSGDGYTLETRDVAVGLKTKRIASGGPVTGTMPLGSFGAARLRADLESRTVVLEGGARLHIVQGRAR